MEKVNDFIESLEVQTLTDELKEDIISIVNDAIEQAYNLGRIDGMNRAVEIIKQANGES
jgi:flagellar biosynthesis component FlhA